LLFLVNCFVEKIVYSVVLGDLDKLVTEIEQDFSEMKSLCPSKEGNDQSELYEILISDMNIRNLKRELDRFSKDYQNLFKDYWDTFAKIDRYFFVFRNNVELTCSETEKQAVIELYEKHYGYIENAFMAAILPRSLTSDIDLSGKNGELFVKLEKLFNSEARKTNEDKRVEKENGLGDLEAKMSNVSGLLKALDRKIDQFGKNRSKGVDKFNSGAADKIRHSGLDYFDAITGDNIDMQLDGDIKLNRSIPWVNNKYSKLCFGENVGRQGTLSKKEGSGSGDNVIQEKDQQNYCIRRHEAWEKERDFWVFYTSDISGIGRNLITLHLEDSFKSIKKVLRFSARTLKYIQKICENQDTEISCE